MARATATSSTTTTATRSSGRVTNGDVRVLLQANRSTILFRHATQAGNRALTEDTVYKATRDGNNVILRSASGRQLEIFHGVMRVVGGKHVRVLGRADNGVRDGLYRDALEIRTAAGSGLNAINAVGLEKLSARCRAGREPCIVARRRARGPGRRRAFVRARVERERQGLRPVRGHSQPDVPRVPGRDAVDERRRRQHHGAGRHLRRRDRYHVLLLHLRGLHRKRRERLYERLTEAVAEGRQGSLRRLLALSPLGSVHVLALRAREQAGRLGQGPAEELQGARAGSVAARGEGAGEGESRQHPRDGAADPHAAGAARHVVLRASRAHRSAPAARRRARCAAPARSSPSTERSTGRSSTPSRWSARTATSGSRKAPSR